MPTRYLKPGIRDSDRIEAVLEPDAEILFYRLLIVVDDFGRTDARPLMVKSECFPIRMRVSADNCMQWLKMLDSARLIGLYEVNGKPYLQIAKWDNKPRAMTSKYPEPSADVYNRMQMLPVTVTVTVTVTETKTGTETKHEQPQFELPDWIDKQDWDLWIKTRKGKKMIPAQMQAQVNKLDAWRLNGIDHAQALKDAAAAGWSGLFEPKKSQQSTSVQQARLTVAQQIMGGTSGTHRPIRDITPGRTIEGDQASIPEAPIRLREPDAG